MQGIDASKVRLYVVWMPILKNDSEEVAAEAAAELIDPRAHHYWNPDLSIGREASRRLGVEAQLDAAWDVFLFFAPDATWKGPGKMPEPAAWMHRLTAPEDPRWMTKERFARVVAALLPD